MNNQLQETELGQIIQRRRTIKPDRMNGRRIGDADVQELLALADWAPTHARTEPWRFIVYGPSATKAFARQHAELFRSHTPEASFTQLKYDNIERLGHNVSHIVVVWMKRIPSHKIPEAEEIAATAAAVQNLLLGATARGIASFWSTGGMTYHPAMKEELGLGDEDRMIGIIYLGYSDEPMSEGTRMIPLSEKTQWVK